MTHHGLAIVTHRAITDPAAVDQAIKLFSKIPSSDEVSCSKGVALLISGRLEEAVREFQNSQSVKQRRRFFRIRQTLSHISC